jgi:2-polyprenyl-3-methyl-5-hydroxy-6-metoxy-1,4-benzoquinol methylase
MNSNYFSCRKSCPACNSERFKEIYRIQYDQESISDYLESFYSPQGGVDLRYLKNATYCLCECSECSLIFQKEIPNDFLMETLYERWIDAKKMFMQQQEDDLNLYSYYAQEISTIIAYLRKTPSSLDVLDFGMGWGKWALMAKAFGCKSFGTEISKERVDFALSNSITVLSYEEIQKYEFDYINNEQVFEHISNPLETLLYLKKSLKPNGIIKISVPTANNIKKRLKTMDWKAPKGSRNSLNPVAPLEHINYFPRKSLIRMAEIVGLKEVFIPIKVQYMYKTNWSGMRMSAKNLLLPIIRNLLMRRNYLFFRKN